MTDGTNDHDDDALDLSAWQPPAAPDVTDAVLARMRAVPAAEPPARTRWWLAGIAGAAIAASATALWIRHGSAPAESPPGTLVAVRAEHLALDGASADVDAGATLHWAHDRDGLRVEQRGSATWTVGDRLRIDAGAGSIEATAANLRVEVEMNRQDLRVISTSALTAAAVALVTVIVYDGHVRATSAGQTITLAAGTTFQIVPDHPPRPLDVVGAAPPVLVMPPPPPPPLPPAPPVPPPAPSVELDHKRVQCLEFQSKHQWAELAVCAAELADLDAARGKQLADLATSELRSEAALDKLAAAIARRDLPAAYAAFSSIPLSSVYASAAMTRYKPFESEITDKLVAKARDLASRKKCDDIETLATNAGSPAAETAVRAVGCTAVIKINPYDTRDGSAAACNTASLKSDGDMAYTRGDFVAARTAFDAAYRCSNNSDAQTLARAYQSACKGHEFARAQALFHELPAMHQGNAQLIQLCLVQGFDPRKLVCQPMSHVDPMSATPVCGALDVHSDPVAHISIDGIDTGTQTPTHIPDLLPGKHKVTYKVGDDKFTFTVDVKPGETATLSKLLK